MNIREFIKQGFLEAVGNMPDYKIRLNSAGWYEKEVLLEEDLEEIDNAINEQYKLEEIDIIEELPEETQEESEE